MSFRHRSEAGKKLALALIKYKDAIVLALPRGGVVIGAQIAKILNLPLDLLFVRKIGHPNNPEYAVCAVSENNYRVCTKEEISTISNKWLEDEINKQLRLIKRQREIYLKGKKSLILENKIVILVDDGIATGLTMEAAVLEIKAKKVKKVIVAIPVMPKDSFKKFKAMVDEIVVLEIPEKFFGSVGNYYSYFPQVSDKKVISLL